MNCTLVSESQSFQLSYNLYVIQTNKKQNYLKGNPTLDQVIEGVCQNYPIKRNLTKSYFMDKSSLKFSVVVLVRLG